MSVANTDVTPWLRLILAEAIGPTLAHRLLDRFGTPEAIFEASENELLETQIGANRLTDLRARALSDRAKAEARRIAETDVRLVTLTDPEYPAQLRELPYCPLALWVRGAIGPDDRLSVAVVGSRSPSAYGRQMVSALAGPLAAQGLTIISGLAHGIDSQAHCAALDAGGRTVAVLGQGLGSPVYPPANAKLAERIVEEERGALVSPFAMDTPPASGLFPMRNEIIAGWSLGVLVVEAAHNSGALITARHGAGLNRPVMACPGDANRRSAQGANRLIADGAALVQRPEDVLAALGSDLRRGMEAVDDDANAPEPNDAPTANLTPAWPTHAVARDLRALIQEEPTPADVLLVRCAERGHTHAAVLECLLQLELNGLLRQLPGRIYSLQSLAEEGSRP